MHTIRKTLLSVGVLAASAFVFFYLQDKPSSPAEVNSSAAENRETEVKIPVRNGNDTSFKPESESSITGLALNLPQQAKLSDSDTKLLELGKAGNLQEALAFIKSHYPENRKNAALRFLLGAAGVVNLDSIAVLVPHFTEKSERQVAFGVISQRLIESGRGIDALINYAESSTTGEIKNEIFSQAISSATNARCWDICSKLIERMPFSSSRTAAITNFASGYAHDQPTNALQWASSLQVLEDRTSAKRAVIAGMSRNGDASSLLGAMPDLEPEGRGQAGDAIGKLAMQQNRPIADLLAEERQRPNSAAPIFLGAVSVATRPQLELLIPEFEKLPAGSTRNRAAAHIAARMFTLSQQDGAKWALSLTGSERETAIRSVVAKWYNSDSLELSDWVNGLQNNRDGDAAKETMVGLIKGSDKNAATELAKSITDAQRRDRVIRQLR